MHPIDGPLDVEKPRLSGAFHYCTDMPKSYES